MGRAGLDRAATEGSYFPVHFLLKDNRPTNPSLDPGLQSQICRQPTTLAALGYEATSTLLAAIQQAGAVEVKAVAPVLAGGEFEGLSGPFTFDAQHNPLKPVPVVQLQGNQRSLVRYVSPP
ncbi:MAG: ABC transporter substrate-binding protein [Anaerolineae bacterium]